MPRFLRALVAVVFGNALYFYWLAPRSPDWVRHRPFAFDAGLFLDFILCLAIYFGLGRFGRRKQTPPENS